MHPYLKHLLNDIQNAHNITDKDLEEKAFAVTDLETHFQDIEAWATGESQKPFKEFCGLSPDDFPPADQFTDKEKLMVCEEFEHMLNSWNIGLDMPPDVPAGMRYRLTVDILGERCIPPRMGFFHFDFCTGVPEGCKLEQYCPCLKYV